jgi:hypothetical protein
MAKIKSRKSSRKTTTHEIAMFVQPATTHQRDAAIEVEDLRREIAELKADRKFLVKRSLPVIRPPSTEDQLRFSMLVAVVLHELTSI